MGDFDLYPPPGPYAREAPKDRESFSDSPGNCPDCGSRSAGPLIVCEGDYWFCCDAHGKAWCVGRRLQDYWRDVTPDAERTALERLAEAALVPVDGYLVA